MTEFDRERADEMLRSLDQIAKALTAMAENGQEILKVQREIYEQQGFRLPSKEDQ